jgi:hypothetical protein
MTLEEMRKMRKEAYQKKVKKYIEHVGAETLPKTEESPKKMKTLPLREKAKRYLEPLGKKLEKFISTKPREVPITYGGRPSVKGKPKRRSQLKEAMKER